MSDSVLTSCHFDKVVEGAWFTHSLLSLFFSVSSHLFNLSLKRMFWFVNPTVKYCFQENPKLTRTSCKLSGKFNQRMPCRTPTPDPTSWSYTTFQKCHHNLRWPWTKRWPSVSSSVSTCLVFAVQLRSDRPLWSHSMTQHRSNKAPLRFPPGDKKSHIWFGSWVETTISLVDPDSTVLEKLRLSPVKNN